MALWSWPTWVNRKICILWKSGQVRLWPLFLFLFLSNWIDNEIFKIAVPTHEHALWVWCSSSIGVLPFNNLFDYCLFIYLILFLFVCVWWWGGGGVELRQWEATVQYSVESRVPPYSVACRGGGSGLGSSIKENTMISSHWAETKARNAWKPFSLITQYAFYISELGS